MKNNPKTYYTEFEALQFENEQLAEWLRLAQEEILRNQKFLNKIISFIERLTCTNHIGNGRFLRKFQIEKRDFISEKFFLIDEDGKIINCLLRPIPEPF